MGVATVEILDVCPPPSGGGSEPRRRRARRRASAGALTVALAIAASTLLSEPATAPRSPRPAHDGEPGTELQHRAPLASVALGPDLPRLHGPSALTSSLDTDAVWVLDRGSLSSTSGTAGRDRSALAAPPPVLWWGERVAVHRGSRLWALPIGLAGEREPLGRSTTALASSDRRWAWLLLDQPGPLVRATRLDAASGRRSVLVLDDGGSDPIAVGDGLLVPERDGPWSLHRPGEAARPVATAAGLRAGAGRGRLAFLLGPTPLQVTVVDVLADRVVAAHDYASRYAGLRLSGICPSPDGSRYVAVFADRWAVITATAAASAQPLTGLRLRRGWSLAWSGPDQVLSVWSHPAPGAGGELRALDLAAPATDQELVVADLEGGGSWAVSTPDGSCPPGGGRSVS